MIGTQCPFVIFMVTSTFDDEAHIGSIISSVQATYEVCNKMDLQPTTQLYDVRKSLEEKDHPLCLEYSNISHK